MVENLHGLDRDLERVRQALDQPAPRPPAGLPEPPGLLRVAHVLRGPRQVSEKPTRLHAIERT